jgi:hypothetical protein
MVRTNTEWSVPHAIVKAPTPPILMRYRNVLKAPTPPTPAPTPRWGLGRVRSGGPDARALPTCTSKPCHTCTSKPCHTCTSKPCHAGRRSRTDCIGGSSLPLEELSPPGWLRTRSKAPRSPPGLRLCGDGLRCRHAVLGCLLELRTTELAHYDRVRLDAVFRSGLHWVAVSRRGCFQALRD